MLKAQGGVFALVSAEGGGIFENIGRYADKGGLEIYLNGYSGDRVCVDRKTSESIVIDRPTLTIIALCQPTVIEDLFSDRQKVGRGLLSRILYVKCPSRVGSRKAAVDPLPERIADNYRNLCNNVLFAQSRGNLKYDNGGFRVWCDFFDEIERQLTPDVGELSFMGDWAGKLPGQMTRIAGLLHCINAFEHGNNPLDTAINTDETRAAAMLAGYFLAHAKAIYSEQAEPKEITNARYLWNRITSANAPQIGKRELLRLTHGKDKKTFDIAESMAVLVERGYIRVDNVPTGGRPAETITINPEAVNISTKAAIAPSRESLGTLDTFNSDVPNIKPTENLPEWVEITDEDLPF
jgi:hypothetical protein